MFFVVYIHFVVWDDLLPLHCKVISKPHIRLALELIAVNWGFPLGTRSRILLTLQKQKFTIHTGGVFLLINYVWSFYNKLHFQSFFSKLSAVHCKAFSTQVFVTAITLKYNCLCFKVSFYDNLSSLFHHLCTPLCVPVKSQWNWLFNILENCLNK